MYTGSDPQTRAGPAPELANHYAGEDDDDYSMTDAFDDRSGADMDPLDYQFGAPHMLILDKLPEVISYHPPQVVCSSAQKPVYGNEISQSTRYWEFLQCPQSIPSGRSSKTCPTPTSLPSGPNQTSQLSGHLGTAVMNTGMSGPSRIHTDSEQEWPPPPSCDHISCHPPSNVGLLSRRFEENENWIRGRAFAVASRPQNKRGIYSMPIELIEMIPDYFPVVDPSTGSAMREEFLRTWNRHTAFEVLAGTCTYLWKLFYKRSWRIKTVTGKSLSTMVGLLKDIRVQAYAPLVETLITQLPTNNAELLKECLLALPCLHTLVIVDDGSTMIGSLKTVFRNTPDFPNIRKAVIPASAHPILSRLPNVGELICFDAPGRLTVTTTVLSSLRGPYVKERNGTVEPVLKSCSLTTRFPDRRFYEVLVDRFPRLRKVCLPLRREEENLRGLKELVEFEILVDPYEKIRPRVNIDQVKSFAIDILQKSECHKDCGCNHKCGCAKTNECNRCDPPKRFVRIKTFPSKHGIGSGEMTVDGGSCLEEIQVSSRGVVSTK